MIEEEESDKIQIRKSILLFSSIILFSGGSRIPQTWTPTYYFVRKNIKIKNISPRKDVTWIRHCYLSLYFYFLFFGLIHYMHCSIVSLHLSLVLNTYLFSVYPAGRPGGISRGTSRDQHAGQRIREPHIQILRNEWQCQCVIGYNTQNR